MDLNIGDKVKIQGITDEDADLNGLTGVLSRKFFTRETSAKVFGDVGVWLDRPVSGSRAVNVQWSEVEAVDGSSSHSNGVNQ